MLSIREHMIGWNEITHAGKAEKKVRLVFADGFVGTDEGAVRVHESAPVTFAPFLHVKQVLENYACWCVQSCSVKFFCKAVFAAGDKATNGDGAYAPDLALRGCKCHEIELILHDQVRDCLFAFQSGWGPKDT